MPHRNPSAQGITVAVVVGNTTPCLCGVPNNAGPCKAVYMVQRGPGKYRLCGYSYSNSVPLKFLRFFGQSGKNNKSVINKYPTLKYV